MSSSRESPKPAAKERRSQKTLEAQVGAFVVLLFFVGCGVVLLLGRSQHILARQVTVQAFFDDVQGLKAGAPVRLAGVNVGTVATIGFVRDDNGTAKVRVTLHIEKHLFGDVRVDSVARIDAQGLLGDKIVDISVGGANAEEVPPGGTLQSSAPADLNALMAQAGEVMQQVKLAATHAATAMDALANPATINDVRVAVHSMRVLVHQAEVGDGLAHQLFYDKRTSREIDELAQNLNQLTTNVNHGVQRLDLILDATDENGKKLLNNVSRAALNIGQVAQQLHDSRVVPNMERAMASAALTAEKANGIIDYVKSGQGTLGGVIMDPTAYEQLLTILGGVQRSRLLRFAVRYAISRSDKKAAAAVPLEEQRHLVKNAAVVSR